MTGLNDHVFKLIMFGSWSEINHPCTKLTRLKEAKTSELALEWVEGVAAVNSDYAHAHVGHHETVHGLVSDLYTAKLNGRGICHQLCLGGDDGT